MKKRILLALFLIVFSLLSACRKDPSAYGDSIYSNIKAPAFSGYICGYEGSKTFCNSQFLFKLIANSQLMK